MSVLWLTAEPPDPARGGGALRQAGLLRELGRHVPVDLVVVGDPPAPSVAAAVRRTVVVPAPAPRPRRQRIRSLRALAGWPHVPEVDGARSTRRRLLDAASQAGLLGGAELTVITHLPLAPLLPDLPGVTVFHPFHVVSEQLRGEAACSAPRRAARLRRYAGHAAALERWAVETAALTVAVSAEDVALLGGGDRLRVSPNAVDLPPATAVTPRPAEPTVLFPASLDYAPNVDGACWFVDEVWPLVRARRPDARLVLAGRSPVPAVRALGDRPGVEVVGDVPAMGPWLEQARIVVVPLRFGTGTRMKALEAIAAGRPVTGTTVGLAGLGLVPGVHAAIADDPPALAEAVVATLGHHGDALVGPARAHLDATHTWTAAVAPLLEALGQRTGGR